MRRASASRSTASPRCTRNPPTTPKKKETALPPLEEGQTLKLKKLTADQKFTQPPPLYTEATLIHALEENGIGRPSTYAPIITTIVDRGYVEKDQKKLKTTPLGQAVNTVMMEQFPDIVNVKFSADMEKKARRCRSRPGGLGQDHRRLLPGL